MEEKFIIDTREQLPLDFRKSKNYDIINEKLDEGDYGIKYGEKLLAVYERKSGVDFYGSLIQGHDRFRREILRTIDKDYKFLLVIECCYDDFINKKFDGGYRLKLKSHILTKILHTFINKYNIGILFFNNRQEMQHFIKNDVDSILKRYKKKNEV